jgi:hypothetical protein
MHPENTVALAREAIESRGTPLYDEKVRRWAQSLLGPVNDEVQLAEVETILKSRIDEGAKSAEEIVVPLTLQRVSAQIAHDIARLFGNGQVDPDLQFSPPSNQSNSNSPMDNRTHRNGTNGTPSVDANGSLPLNGTPDTTGRNGAVDPVQQDTSSRVSQTVNDPFALPSDNTDSAANQAPDLEHADFSLNGASNDDPEVPANTVPVTLTPPPESQPLNTDQAVTPPAAEQPAPESPPEQPVTNDANAAPPIAEQAAAEAPPVQPVTTDANVTPPAADQPVPEATPPQPEQPAIPEATPAAPRNPLWANSNDEAYAKWGLVMQEMTAGGWAMGRSHQILENHFGHGFFTDGEAQRLQEILRDWRNARRGDFTLRHALAWILATAVTRHRIPVATANAPAHRESLWPNTRNEAEAKWNHCVDGMRVAQWQAPQARGIILGHFGAHFFENAEMLRLQEILAEWQSARGNQSVESRVEVTRILAAALERSRLVPAQAAPANHTHAPAHHEQPHAEAAPHHEQNHDHNHNRGGGHNHDGGHDDHGHGPKPSKYAAPKHKPVIEGTKEAMTRNGISPGVAARINRMLGRDKRKGGGHDAHSADHGHAAAH